MEGTGLENELLSGEAEALPHEEVETDRANHNNDGQYGWIELDGKQCTNDYTSRAYGQQYCVGDTYTDPNGGSQTIRDIGFHGLDLAPNQWDAEETYADVGEKLGMSMEEWTEFSAEIQELNGNVDALKGNMFGPTEQERGRLGIRISNENPDWSEAEVMAEVDKVLEEKWMTSDAYAEAAAAETALFEKYNIRKENPGVYGSGIWIDEDGKYHKFESSSGNLWQTSQDTSFLDVAVPLGIAVGASLIAGGGAASLFNGSGLLASSGLGPTMQGAFQGAIGSAFGQGVTGNGIDPKKLLQSAMLGGLGGFVDQLSSMDGNIMENLLLGKADDLVNSTADLLSMNYDQALDLLSGVVEGAIKGGDLESIVGGVIENYGTVQIQNYLTTTFGEYANVDDWFGPGQSHIPMTAFEPIISGSIEAALNGGMSAEDAIKMAWGYFQEGGDIDFMLPKFKDFISGIPGLDFEKGGWGIGYDEESGDIVINHDFDFDFDWGGVGSLPELGNPCTTAEGQEGKILAGALEGQWICNPTLPSFNIGDLCYDDEGNPGVIGQTGLCDIELPDLNIGAPCTDPEGNEGKFILGPDGNSAICNVELPNIDIGGPCTDPEGNEGTFILGPDGNSAICNVEVDINIGLPCTDPEGNEGKFILGPDGNSTICNVELPNIDIGGPCTDPEGNEGTFILGPDGNSAICNVELPSIDIGGPCTDPEGNEGTFILGPDGNSAICNVELPNIEPIYCTEEQKAKGWSWDSLKEECLPEVPDVLPCMEGWEWSDLYEECIEIDFEIPEWELPEWETPDLDFPDIDIDLPDLPDLPEAPAPKQASKHEFTPTEQFAYTDVKGYTAPAKRQTHDYLQGKGLLK